MVFRFNDEKSRKQINIALCHRNDTKQNNANGLLAYRIKQARLIGSRNEWELHEYELPNSA